jgi:hypothetical protein
MIAIINLNNFVTNFYHFLLKVTEKYVYIICNETLVIRLLF